jgi:hypothetical protein
MKPTLDLSNPIDIQTLANLNPPADDGMVHAFDQPADNTPAAAIGGYPAQASDYANAFDPNNKNSFSPAPALSLVKSVSDYGYRAGVTETHPIITASDAPSVPTPSTAQKPSYLIKIALVAGAAYVGYKFIFKAKRS